MFAVASPPAERPSVHPKDFFAKGREKIQNVGNAIFSSNIFYSFWCLPNVRDDFSALKKEFGVELHISATQNDQERANVQMRDPAREQAANASDEDGDVNDFHSAPKRSGGRRDRKFKVSPYELSCLQGYYGSSMSRDDLDVMMKAQYGGMTNKVGSSTFFQVSRAESNARIIMFINLSFL